MMREHVPLPPLVCACASLRRAARAVTQAYDAELRTTGMNPTQFTLLHFLARKPGWAFSRAQIVDAVKGEDYPVTERSVDVQVVGLRKKLGDLGSYIETVRGVGYRFKE